MPILGASIVIGKNRNRLFSDGRPQKVAGDNNPLTRHWPEARSITPVIADDDGGVDLCQQSFADVSVENLMPVRLAPDGGEDVSGVPVEVDGGSSSPVAQVTMNEQDEDQWSDWEDNEEEVGQEVMGITPSALIDPIEHLLPLIKRPLDESLMTKSVSTTIGDNLDDLDIRVKPTKDDDEMDFFKDMEPTIVKREVDVFAPVEEEEKTITTTSRLTLQTTMAENNSAEDGNNGWGDSDWE